MNATDFATLHDGAATNHSAMFVCRLALGGAIADDDVLIGLLAAILRRAVVDAGKGDAEAISFLDWVCSTWRARAAAQQQARARKRGGKIGSQ